ncbi:hypothetical protein MUO83_08575 [Candidatus Bathyarchaeota archaeon]|nr:hypothetical protein [Candidatus Bathyarchaeota archaeon]
MVATWKKLAFADEVATLSAEVAHDIGTTASAGVATDASRHDHVHRLGNGAVDVAAVLAADVVDGTKIADDAVGSEHIEPLSAKLECNGQQLENAVLENNAADPTTPVLGKIYFKTGDTHPYVCTAIA